MTTIVDVKTILLDTRRLRGYARHEMTVNELKAAHERLGHILLERIKEEEELVKAAKQHEENVKEVAKILLDKGVGLDEVMAAMQSPDVKYSGDSEKPKRVPKYEYFVNGKRKTWTGQGRMPSVIQNELDKGIKLDSFKV